MEGSENGGGMDGSENGGGMDGSENGDGMDCDGENSGSDDHVNRNRNGLQVFTENVGVILDITGKEPVNCYWLFVTDSHQLAIPHYSQLLSRDCVFSSS